MNTKEKTTEQQAASAGRSLRITEGERAHHLDLFGDFIAKREGYSHHRGTDALHFYLVQKYHWLPRDVRSLSWKDLHFLLDEEMLGIKWTVPAELRGAPEA